MAKQQSVKYLVDRLTSYHKQLTDLLYKGLVYLPDPPYQQLRAIQKDLFIILHPPVRIEAHWNCLCGLSLRCVQTDTYAYDTSVPCPCGLNWDVIWSRSGKSVQVDLQWDDEKEEEEEEDKNDEKHEEKKKKQGEEEYANVSHA